MVLYLHLLPPFKREYNCSHFTDGKSQVLPPNDWEGDREIYSHQIFKANDSFTIAHSFFKLDSLK